jgi:CRISPR-associated protein Cmr1
MAELSSITLECETVTPLFLGGADPSGAPELRAPSLRGALRYWFRALSAEQDPKALLKQESELFGGTGKDSTASSIALHILSGQCQYKSWEQIIGKLPREQHRGLRYLGFPFRAEQSGQPRSGIIENQLFRIKISLLPLAVFQQPRIFPLKALASLWAAIYLGGLGARSRRGFGSLRVRSVSGILPDDAPPFLSKLRTVDDAADFYLSGIRAALQAFTLSQQRSQQLTLPNYNILASEWCRVLMLKGRRPNVGGWPDWHTALADLGNQLSELRRKLPLASRVAFGLPIQQVDVRDARDQKKKIRRSSPILVRVVGLETGVTLALIAFRSQILPNNVVASAHGRTFNPAESDNIIGDLLKSLSSRLGGPLDIYGSAFQQ